MAETYGRPAGSPSAWLRGGYMRSPVLWTWFGMALLLSAFVGLGLNLNADPDDLLKLHEIRFVLSSGGIFERTLPGILQPEPFVTHWPALVDFPYVALAVLLSPVAGQETALVAASYAVPLLLLGPALYFFHRIVAALGFAHPAIVLPLAAILAFRSFSEFAPGRIDYHNLQVLLLLASLALLLVPGRAAAASINGCVTALALAVSLEFALFFALVLAVYALDFVRAAQGSAARLSTFGTAMAATAAALFAISIAPSAYGVAICDSYSAPHLTALACAGLSFAAAPVLVRTHDTFASRAAVLVLLASTSLAALAFLFPQCLAGPYASLGDYVRSNWLDRIGQEKSLFARSDFVLSPSFLSMTILFVGAIAPAALSIANRGGDRNLAIFALFSLLALAHAVLYFRYIRYLPLFSAIGLMFVVAALSPVGSTVARYIGTRPALALPPRYLLVLPGLVLAAALGLFHLVVRPVDALPVAAQVADGCDLSETGRYEWPDGTRILSPPLIGIHLLSPQPGQAVVAIPFHAAARGVERAYRFLDPATADPHAVLDAAQATHVAVCAWRDVPLPGLSARYPFAAALMEGRPPSWLEECPETKASPLRVYRYRNAGQPELACPGRL